MSSSWVYLIFWTYYHRLVSSFAHTHISWRQAKNNKTKRNKKHTKIFLLLLSSTFNVSAVYSTSKIRKRLVDLWCMNQFFYPHFSLTQSSTSPKCISAYRPFFLITTILSVSFFFIINYRVGTLWWKLNN